MQIISSYKVKLQDHRSALRNTVRIYREAVSFLINVIDTEWDVIGPLYKKSVKLGQSAMERMIHRTSKNLNPKYDFDADFYKFPSYFRRAAIDVALGAVSSYRSNLGNWETSGCKGHRPKLTLNRNVMPVFYRTGMCQFDDMLSGKSCLVKLKLYVNHDWVWIDIPCRKQDIDYLHEHWDQAKPFAPTLVMERKPKQRNVHHLVFAFPEIRDLSDNDVSLEDQTIFAVDLGINTDATCSVMKKDGTVIARKFINFTREKDRLYHLLNRIRRLQREHGSKTGGKHEWKRTRRMNVDLAKKISKAIVDTAVFYRANVIVFEHLEFKGKRRGGKKQRLHMWRKQDIQARVEHGAHRNLIRISRVCAWGTSRLAFDGSGPVIRDENNHQLAAFANGKRYNCDLSASYNIGARYFLREMCKLDPDLINKLPSASRRTYADLRAVA